MDVSIAHLYVLIVHFYELLAISPSESFKMRLQGEQTLAANVYTGFTTSSAYPRNSRCGIYSPSKLFFHRCRRVCCKKTTHWMIFKGLRIYRLKSLIKRLEHCARQLFRHGCMRSCVTHSDEGDQRTFIVWTYRQWFWAALPLMTSSHDEQQLA